MSAMENATKNAGEMIRKLSLQYNKQRQAGITKELLEIISGSESQKVFSIRELGETVCQHQPGQNIGRIKQVIGPIVDVEFESGRLPAIYTR